MKASLDFGHIHGGNVYNNNTLGVEYDFSANINPLGMSQKAKNKLMEESYLFERYPDVGCTKLKEVISKKYNISADYIVCGNGASELIYKLMHVSDKRNVLITTPTFSEYEIAAKQNSKEICYYKRTKENEFKIKEDILEAIPLDGIVAICCPNNPTGDLTDVGLLYKIIEKSKDNNSVVFLDFSFIEFCDEYEEYKKFFEMDNVICLMAFTKYYAMPGLRLGFTISSDLELNYKLHEYGDCWSVSAPAQIAGYYSLCDMEYIDKTKVWIKSERDYLYENIEKLGYKVYKPSANFILIEEENYELDKQLLEYKIMIRNCESFLLDKYYRVAVRSRSENDILLEVLRKIKIQDNKVR